MAHKKGQGSSRNGRDSNAQRLGVKKFGGEVADRWQHLRSTAQHHSGTRAATSAKAVTTPSFAAFRRPSRYFDQAARRINVRRADKAHSGSSPWILRRASDLVHAIAPVTVALTGGLEANRQAVRSILAGTPAKFSTADLMKLWRRSCGSTATPSRTSTCRRRRSPIPTRPNDLLRNVRDHGL